MRAGAVQLNATEDVDRNLERADRLVRALPKAWLHMVGNIIVMLLALFNSFVHSRDAWTRWYQPASRSRQSQSLSCCLPGGSAGRWCTGTVWELRHDT